MSPEQDLREAEARERLELVARGLVLLIGVEVTARVLVDTLIGLLLGNGGRGPAIDFLRGALADVESVHPEDSAPW